jgi:hypothetical protein
MIDRTRLPTFIIGGAPRSGTTFLCHALDRHPDVYMAKPYIPEPKVFLGAAKDPSKYYERYAEYFGPECAHKARGDKTTLYFENVEGRQRLRQFLPEDIRLLFILREPVARAYSNYLWSKRNGLEHLSFEEAVDLEGNRPNPLPEEKSYARPHDYLVRGDYAQWAAAYLEEFGPERVAFFLYEDIERRPEGLLNDIHTFIGIKPRAFANGEVGVINSAKDVGPELDPDLKARLQRRMAPSVARFALLTGLDISPWGYE